MLEKKITCSQRGTRESGLQTDVSLKIFKTQVFKFFKNQNYQDYQFRVWSWWINGNFLLWFLHSHSYDISSDISNTIFSDKIVSTKEAVTYKKASKYCLLDRLVLYRVNLLFFFYFRVQDIIISECGMCCDRSRTAMAGQRATQCHSLILWSVIHPCISYSLLHNSHPKNQGFRTRVICLCSHVCGSSRVLCIYTGLGGDDSASYIRSVVQVHSHILLWSKGWKASGHSWESVLMATAETWDAEWDVWDLLWLRTGTLSLLLIYHQAKQSTRPSPKRRGREIQAVCEETMEERRGCRAGGTVRSTRAFTRDLTTPFCDFLIVYG